MARRSSSTDGLTLGAVAELVGGQLDGDPARRVRRVAEIEAAGAGDLVFCSDARRAEAIAAGTEAAVIAASDLDMPSGADVVRCADPHLAVALVLEALHPVERLPAGIDASAVVADGVSLGEGASVGPLAVVGEGAVIGARTQIGPGSVIGPGVTLGEDCLLHARATFYDGVVAGDRLIVHAGAVIGADGFGYARDGVIQVKVPQVGGVVLGDDVEIGANACIDRGTLGPTIVGDGTKIDNLVQVGHNCRIGKHCAISGLTGLSGSTVLGDGVILGGNVGTAGHQVIGKGSMVAAKTGVHGDLPPASIVGGYPHMEIRLWRRVVGASAKLPRLLRRVRRLERAVEDLNKE